jgi:hypothetical protein
MIHDEEIHSLYRLHNIVRVVHSRRLKWAGHVARMEGGRNTFKTSTGKPTGKRFLGKPRRRWGHNIRVDLKEISINTRNLVGWTQYRDYWRAPVNAALNAAMNLQVS